MAHCWLTTKARWDMQIAGPVVCARPKWDIPAPGGAPEAAGTLHLSYLRLKVLCRLALVAFNFSNSSFLLVLYFVSTSLGLLFSS